ncbi:MAG: hypothetical protein AAFQ98_24375 [Bacteroidota bacterium]
MKSILLSFFFLLIAFVSNAQPQYGDLTLGSGIHMYYHSSPSAPPTYGGSFNPGAGIFVTDHLMIGSATICNFSSFETYGFRINNLVLGLAPRIAYYFGSGPWQPYLSTSFGFAAYSTREFIDQYTPQTTAMGDLLFQAEAGAVYWLSKQIGLSFSLNFSTGQPLEDPEDFTHEGLSGNIGLQYIWPK